MQARTNVTYRGIRCFYRRAYRGFTILAIDESLNYCTKTKEPTEALQYPTNITRTLIASTDR